MKRLQGKMYHQSSFAQRRRFQICFHLPEDQNIKWDIHLLTSRDPWMHWRNALIRRYEKEDKPKKDCGVTDSKLERLSFSFVDLCTVTV